MPLFDDPIEADRRTPVEKIPPLADRMRPRSIAEVVGQDHLLGPGKALQRIIARGIPVSMIFWGPPGSGKTTIARLISSEMNAIFVEYSAVLSGVKQIREVIDQADRYRLSSGKHTILFIDEIHRFNKSQQDAFLPHVENGTITLVGATTENPSFEVIPALLSRCRVFTLKSLSRESLNTLINRALVDEVSGLGKSKFGIDPDAMDLIAADSGGDARVALNTLELATNLCTASDAGDGDRLIRLENVQEALQTKPPKYDKSGEHHFNHISAFHKSIRGSDPQAALYWMSRMLNGGEDPMYLARRMIRIATEDIGLADPQALIVTIAAREAFHILGSPEGELALAEAAVYLATAPKSNAIYLALDAAKAAAMETDDNPVPLHLRNAPTRLMKSAGYGSEYIYDHDVPGAFAGQEFLPEALAAAEFYRPKSFGFEREIIRRLDWWKKRKSEMTLPGDSANKTVDNPE